MREARRLPTVAAGRTQPAWPGFQRYSDERLPPGTAASTPVAAAPAIDALPARPVPVVHVHSIDDLRALALRNVSFTRQSWVFLRRFSLQAP